MTRSGGKIGLPLLLVVILLGCGAAQEEDLPGEEITCEWFEGSNCWRTSLASFSDSLPDGNALGIFSADGKTCVYDDGTEIIFVEPIELARLDEQDYLIDFLWDFEIRTGGDFLASYREPDTGGLLLISGTGTFKIDSQAPSIIITCPSGLQYNLPQAGLLQVCDPGDIPSKRVTWEPDGVTFSIGGTGGANRLLFNCQVP